MNPGQPQIELLYIDSGGGHRAAATALETVIREQRRPWGVRLQSVQDLFDSIDFVCKTTGIRFQDVYNIMLRRGWTLGTAQLIPAMHLAIRVLHRAEVRVLEKHWTQNPPDMVVSLIPHYNRAFKEAMSRALPGVPLVTVMTDIADYPPHFWIEPQDQYLICGSDRAVEQARLLQHPRRQTLRASGMILNPRFHVPVPMDRAAERVRLGLRPDAPTGLVMFGGEGSTDLVRVAKALNHVRCGVQLIVLCGKHEEAARKLRSMERHVPMCIERFTREVPHYMALADFFIGKPGPGSLSEALAMNLPVIVESNRWTLAHERYNADWILEQQVGIVVDSFSTVRDAVAKLLAPENYRRYRANAAAQRNYAVFEVVEMLQQILAAHPHQEVLAGVA